MPGFNQFGFDGYFPGASPPPPPTASPGGYFPGGYFPAYFTRYFPGAGAFTGTVVVAPIGTGATFLAAALDVFNNPALADFKVVFNRAFTDEPLPVCEVYEARSESRNFSGRRYLEYIDLRLVVWEEDDSRDADEPRVTRTYGELVRDTFDFCYLAFDDGVLRQFRRVGNPIARDGAGRTRGSTKLFSYTLTYRAVVARALPAGVIAR